MFGRHILAALFLNIGVVMLFSGCYSSMHQAQVTDGYSMTFAFRPLHREFIHEGFSFADTDLQINDTIASMGLRLGRAPMKKGEPGYSVGILVDWNAAETKIIQPDDRIDNDFGPLLVRGSFYYQFPKNSLLDVGVGGEFGFWSPVLPLIPYVVISRDLGTRFTLYSEVRTAFPPVITDNVPRNKHALMVGDILIVPSLGARYDFSENLSFIAEMSLFPKLVDCETTYTQVDGRIYYDEPEEMECTYKSPLEVAPVIGVGIIRHLGGEKKPLSYLDKLVGCLGGLSLLMIFLIYTS